MRKIAKNPICGLKFKQVSYITPFPPISMLSALAKIPGADYFNIDIGGRGDLKVFLISLCPGLSEFLKNLNRGSPYI